MKTKKFGTRKIAAVGIIENRNGQLLLLSRNYEPFGFCLPGGKIDLMKESIIEGLIRELKEEIGVQFLINHFDYISEHRSIKGIEVHVFKCKIKNDVDIQLSPEHSAYLYTNSLENINLAGNTKDFLESYVIDSMKIDEYYVFEDWSKYKGKHVGLILEHDPQYILWVDANTHHKFQDKVLKKAMKNYDLLEKLKADLIEQARQESWDRENEIRDAYQRKENLKNAKSADGFGQVIPIGQGRYQQIDDQGNANGKIVEWFYGWSEPDYEDD